MLVSADYLLGIRKLLFNIRSWCYYCIRYLFN